MKKKEIMKVFQDIEAMCLDSINDELEFDPAEVLKAVREVIPEPPKPEFNEVFLTWKIINTWNSDGYVLMTADTVHGSLWKCHLGNYSTLEDAQEAALFYYMLERPQHFASHIQGKALYKSGTHMIYNILEKVLKQEGLDMPPEITDDKSPNFSILINEKPF